MSKEKRPSPHRKSPPRENLDVAGGKASKPEQGVNPEQSTNQRTIELATDQSIAARNLIYNPNESALKVMRQCADGIGFVMARMAHTGNEADDLAKDEVLISMCTRLMADGGTGRIIGFNDRVKVLAADKKPDNYAELVHSLANDCRARMDDITTNAKKAGPEGAVARQGILSFMGDLGGIEPNETGFGAAYAKHLCKSVTDVYATYAAGLCDAQRKLAGESVPATPEQVEAFKVEFNRSRVETSMKGGGLSAPAHTAHKKEERAPLSWAVQERQGLLNTGNAAEEKLQKAIPGHVKSLVDAAWPSYLVSKAVTQDVVEPVTGHVSGTFGEMATTMNMFCGTPPRTVSWQTPSGTPIASADKDQKTSIAAMAAAGLITAGFHSAVEIFQPMSTFTTHATHGSIGPEAVKMMNKQVEALEAYADKLDGNPEKWNKLQEDKDKYVLGEDEVTLNQKSLRSKAQSIADAATKSVDMISMLQGDGGTIATLEIARVLANQSVDPQVPFQLYSLNTRLDELGLRGHTPELEKARTIAKLPVTDAQQQELAVALKAAENAADQRDFLHKKAAEAEAKAAVTKVKLEVAEAMLAVKQEALTSLTNQTNELTKKGWALGASGDEATAARKQIGPLEEERKAAFRAVTVAKLEVTAVKAEAEAASKEAIAAKTELTTINESVRAAAQAEAVAARKEATAARKEARAGLAEADAEEAEAIAAKAEQIVAEKQQALDLATKATDEATKKGWGGGGSPEEALQARQNLDALEDIRKQAFRDVVAAKQEAYEPREMATYVREAATSVREIATKAREEASQARTLAVSTGKEATVMLEKSKSIKEKMQSIKDNANVEPEVKTGPALK